MRINTQRLADSMAELGRVGETPRGGLTRLALSDEDRRGRDLLVEWMRSAGLTVSVDRMGNIFGVRAGREALPPVFMGSHADSVPTGLRVGSAVVIWPSSTNGSRGTCPIASCAEVIVSSSTESVRWTVPAEATVASCQGIGFDSAQSTLTVPKRRWKRSMPRRTRSGRCCSPTKCR